MIRAAQHAGIRKLVRYIQYFLGARGERRIIVKLAVGMLCPCASSLMHDYASM